MPRMVRVLGFVILCILIARIGGARGGAVIMGSGRRKAVRLSSMSWDSFPTRPITLLLETSLTQAMPWSTSNTYSPSGQLYERGSSMTIADDVRQQRHDVDDQRIELGHV